MQIAKNRTMATMIALLLTLTIAVALVALPAASAQSTRKTFAFVGARPNPMGVGQQTLIHLGITEQIGSARDGWENLTVTVTKPDGTTETLGPFRTDSTGGTGTVYTPNVVGNYTLQAHFPEQTYRNIIYLASDSDKLTLVVQQEPIPVYPGVPLPTEYWTRPINAQFREWYTVAGSSWMDDDYNEAPETPHILWTKPLTTGGLVGGELGLVGSGATSVGMETGDAYEGKWGGGFFAGGAPLILAGKLYYQAGAYDRPRLVHCVDLRTGEELWAKTFLDNQSISFGQLFYWESYNYQGTFPYLWVTVGSTWTAFDAFTGEWMAAITNVPSGSTIIGPRGEIYRYTVNQRNGWMALWNLSAFISMEGSFGSAFCLRQYDAATGSYRSLSADGTLGAERTSGGAARVARAWAWNITIPLGLPGNVRAVNLTDRVVGSSTATDEIIVWGFSLKPGEEGKLLFNKTWKTPAEWTAGNLSFTMYGSSWATTDLDTKIGLIWMKELRTHYAFSLETGEYLWKTEVPQYYLDIYGTGRRIYDGKLYSVGYAGIVYCWNLTNGKLLWTYNAKDPYTEILWSSNWPEALYFASGGKLYFFHQEHSGNQPLPRGAPAFCLNATNGEVIWRVDGLYRTTSWGGSPVMGDSVIAMYNTYDQLVYAIGKGPSATTVTAPDIGVTMGSSVMIRGTVTDVSPGTKETALTLRFPNGVPAVSDESMGEWMKYVYAQFPHPASATGVEVTIDAIDPNNNFIHIGTVTSDTSGLFHYAWKTPDVPGEYTVIATFTGSESYYASYAETAMYVGEAPPATPPPQYPIPIDYTLPIVAATIVLLIAIAIVGIMLLRKRP